jgi:hypothetical protein
MAKIPPIRRISTEDFKEQAGWIEKLIAPINEYMERTTSALNRSLTINDNFAGEIRVVEVDGTYPLKLAWNLSSRPQAVLVGQTALSSGAPLTLTEAVQIQWTFNQAGQVEITGVVGVTPSSTVKYKLTLVFLTA